MPKGTTDRLTGEKGGGIPQITREEGIDIQYRSQSPYEPFRTWGSVRKV